MLLEISFQLNHLSILITVTFFVPPALLYTIYLFIYQALSRSRWLINEQPQYIKITIHNEKFFSWFTFCSICRAYFIVQKTVVQYVLLSLIIFYFHLPIYDSYLHITSTTSTYIDCKISSWFAKSLSLFSVLYIAQQRKTNDFIQLTGRRKAQSLLFTHN